MPYTTMIDQEIILEFQGGSDLFVDDPQPMKPTPGGRPHPQHVTTVKQAKSIKLQEIVFTLGKEEVRLVISMKDADKVTLVFVPN
jgi:hypothetical protein